MIIAALALLGFIFGSFVNALVWRLHERAKLSDKKDKAAEKRRRDLSIAKGRSMCPHCSHELAAKDLVPLFSWLWLRGRCRYCQALIGVQYPLVELVTALLFVVSYVTWPLVMHGAGLLQFVFWLAFMVGFVALAVYDLKWFILPDKLVFPLVALAVVQVVVVAAWLHSFSALWQPLVGGLIIFGLFWILFQVSGGNWIGGGDVKLAIVLGLLAGTPLRAFLIIFFASLLGTLSSLPLLVKGRSGLRMHIPFGPYLLLATILVVLYGTNIVNWYQNLIV